MWHKKRVIGVKWVRLVLKGIAGIFQFHTFDPFDFYALFDSYDLTDFYVSSIKFYF